jgi:hypothetical protein
MNPCTPIPPGRALRRNTPTGSAYTYSATACQLGGWGYLGFARCSVVTKYDRVRHKES